MRDDAYVRSCAVDELSLSEPCHPHLRLHLLGYRHDLGGFKLYRLPTRSMLYIPPRSASAGLEGDGVHPHDRKGGGLVVCPIVFWHNVNDFIFMQI